MKRKYGIFSSSEKMRRVFKCKGNINNIQDLRDRLTRTE